MHTAAGQLPGSARERCTVAPRADTRLPGCGTAPDLPAGVVGRRLYSARDVQRCLKRLRTVSFGEAVSVGALSVTAVSSGLAFGAANWVLRSVVRCAGSCAVGCQRARSFAGGRLSPCGRGRLVPGAGQAAARARHRCHRSAGRDRRARRLRAARCGWLGRRATADCGGAHGSRRDADAVAALDQQLRAAQTLVETTLRSGGSVMLPCTVCAGEVGRRVRPPRSPHAEPRRGGAAQTLELLERLTQAVAAPVAVVMPTGPLAVGAALTAIEWASVQRQQTAVAAQSPLALSRLQVFPSLADPAAAALVARRQPMVAVVSAAELATKQVSPARIPLRRLRLMYRVAGRRGTGTRCCARGAATRRVLCSSRRPPPRRGAGRGWPSPWRCARPTTCWRAGCAWPRWTSCCAW
jgi:hypothetical protein